jgi:UDPglucose--hexose-1-phosphate uridylyltransferase
MNEIRKDYFLDRFVIVSGNRGARPNDFVQEAPRLKEGGTCFFCPGNERLTPPETGRVEGARGRWLVRSFCNKFPAVSMEFPNALGSHEVIVETPEHGKQLADLAPAQVRRVIDLYAERSRRLEARKGIAYVSIFKNQGAAAGTSLVHAHSQLIALPEVPPLVARELEGFEGACSRGCGCVFCRVAREEARSERRVFEDGHFVAIAPYASRCAFETWIIPKRHVRKVAGLSPAERDSLARMLKRTLRRLTALFGNPSFNYCLHSAPGASDFHFHVEVLPRLSVWAGFELGSGAYINPVPPEEAAACLRGRRAEKALH